MHRTSAVRLRHHPQPARPSRCMAQTNTHRHFSQSFVAWSMSADPGGLSICDQDAARSFSAAVVLNPTINFTLLGQVCMFQRSEGTLRWGTCSQPSDVKATLYSKLLIHECWPSVLFVHSSTRATSSGLVRRTATGRPWSGTPPIPPHSWGKPSIHAPHWIHNQCQGRGYLL
jgi:hypothetical protein